MKIKMLEYFQGTGVSGVLVRTGSTVAIFAPDEVYEVSADLGKYLLDNRKGQLPSPAPHYGAQAEPVLRNDESLYPSALEAEEPKKKRGRK